MSKEYKSNIKENKMIDETTVKELAECAKEEFGLDIHIGEPDKSLTFERLFGYSMN